MPGKIIQSICARAGWKTPAPDAKGLYAFELEDNISFSLASPDGERLLARAALLTTEEGKEISRDTLESILRIVPARFSRLRAVPYLEEEGGLALHAFTPLRGLENDKAWEFLEGFLNELAFWKAQPALRETIAWRS